jgi:polysaccharide deacetylase family protein (PEP-CTERM system associated)
MTNRDYVRVCDVSIAIGLLMIHGCIIWLKPVPPGIGIVSFAVLCLLLSMALARRSLTARDRRSGSYSVEVIPRPERQVMPMNTITNAFSIDLEDYFHTEVASSVISSSDWDVMPSRVRECTSRMLDLLEEHDSRSTVFVLGWIARKYPSLVRQIAARGHEIACHSDLHRAVCRLDPESFYEDTRIAKASIEDAIGVSIRGYRAPSFSIIPGTEWAFDVLCELDFQYDSSINPVRHKLYGNPGAPRHPHRISRSRLVEIPVASWHIASMNLPVGGGAYLRLLPYSYIRLGLTSINRRESAPFTIYVHPWEIDACQPRMNLNWKSHIRQYWGTSTMEARIAQLLESFRFAPIDEVYEHLIVPTSGLRNKESQVRVSISTPAEPYIGASLVH